MGTVLTGVEFVFTTRTRSSAGSPTAYVEIGQNNLLGLSNQVWIALVLALLSGSCSISELGRYMYAIGGNPEAARLSGIAIRRLRLVGFVIVAVMAAIAGILLTGNSASSSPSFGRPSCCRRSPPCSSARRCCDPVSSTSPGTLIGVLFLGVDPDRAHQLNLEAYVINLVQGGILIFAVLLSRLGQRTV